MSEKGIQDDDENNSKPPPHLSENLSEEVANMWEIPQVYQFLCLAKETLGIQHLSMYEMERMLSMPKASKQLGWIMTSLLSPPMPKSKLRTMPEMPYQFWTNVLTQKAMGWFKVYHSRDEDTVKVLETIGVEPEFWKIFPKPELLSERKFEKLNLRERVWLLKTVCDTLIHSRRSLQDEVAKNYLDDDNEMVLGKDRHGARYIYFPIFLNNDLRVYRHFLDNKILLSVKQVKKEPKPKAEGTNEKKMVRRKRKSWRYGKLPTKSKKKPMKNDKAVEKPEQNESNEKVKSEQENKNYENEENGENKLNESRESDKEKHGDEEQEVHEGKEIDETKNRDQESNLEDKKEEKVVPNAEDMKDEIKDDINTEEKEEGKETIKRDVSRTDDEKINEMKMSISPKSPKNIEESSNGDDKKMIEAELSDKEQLLSENNFENEPREIDEPKINSENCIEKPVNENVAPNIDNDDDNVDGIELKSDPASTTTKKEIEEFNRMITDLGESSFRLVADSLDALRDLIACFTAQNYPEGPETVQCEVQLIKKIRSLIEELENIEPTLKQSRINAKERLEREWENFQNGVKEIDGQPADGERGSNTWILGSQGCPLLANGDTLPQCLVDAQRSLVEGVKIKLEKKDPDEESNDSEPETRRVLRARGISSYVEPFSTSESESDHSELDGWAGFETIDTATGAQIPPPESHPIRPRQTGEESPGEDSDQEWILPSSRKRRRKGSTPSKRYKSFQNKLQAINSHNSTTLLPAVDPISTNSKPKINQLNNALSIRPVNKIKITSVHSELDIKDEGPIIDTVTSGTSDNSSNAGVQQNYVLVNTGNGPVNYVVMPQDNPQQQAHHPVVSVVPPPVSLPQNYYMQSPQGYIVSGPQVNPYRPPYGAPHPMIIQQPPLQPMAQQSYGTQPNNYVQYQQVVPSVSVYPGGVQRPIPNHQSIPGPTPRIPNRDLQIRAVGPNQQRFQPPIGAVIRSAVPFRGPPRLQSRGRLIAPRIGPRPPQSNTVIRPNTFNNKNTPSTLPKAATKTTSLIVLSDSDDEIEMIITEKCDSKTKKVPHNVQTVKRKPVITSEVTVPNKSVLSPQIIQRMNQGGISITPIKPKTPEKSTISSSGGTQLVVVVNETGSHYALALPNGSKLILTPEQVAQIRASNGGKLVL